MSMATAVARVARRLTWTSEQGVWSMPDLERECMNEVDHHVRLRSHRGPMKELLEAGEIAAFPNANRTTYASRVPEQNLYEILVLAGKEVDPEAKGDPGRRSTASGPRSVHFLTPRQLIGVTTWCNHIARLWDPGAGRSKDRLQAAMALVGRDYLQWDPAGGPGGRGDWTRMLDLVRRAAAVRNVPAEEGLGSIRVLLDLAATHGWIPGDIERDNGPRIPAEWAPLFEAFKTACTDVDASGEAVKELLAGCSRAGIDPARAGADEWAILIDDLESSFDSSKTPSQKRGSIRRAYRAIRSSGLINGPDWCGRTAQVEGRRSLVSDASVRTIAEWYGVDTRAASMFEIASKPWPGFSAYSGLVEGVYGLRKTLLQACAPEEVLRIHGLRSRLMNKGQGDAVAAGTLEMHLGLLSMYAGWHRKQGVDFGLEENDLRVLLSAEALEDFYRNWRFADWMSANRRRKLLGVLGKTLRHFALPRSIDRGDREEQTRFERALALLESPTGLDGRPSIKAELDASVRGDVSATSQAEARKVEDGWTRCQEVAEWAYDQIEAVRDALIWRVESQLGATLPEVADDPAAFLSRLDRGGLYDVQCALFFSDQLCAPVRSKAVRRTNLKDRRHSPSFVTVWAEFPDNSMKRRVPFRPNYRKKADATYPVDLYRLWVHPHGARARLLVDANGRSWEEEAFYLQEAKGGTDQAPARRIPKGSASKIVKRGAKRALEFDPQCLGGIDLEELEAAKVLNVHAFRHAVGTRLTSIGKIQEASKILHHVDTRMVQRVYCAITEADIDGSALISRARNREGAPGEVTPKSASA